MARERLPTLLSEPQAATSVPLSKPTKLRYTQSSAEQPCPGRDQHDVSDGDVASPLSLVHSAQMFSYMQEQFCKQEAMLETLVAELAQCTKILSSLAAFDRPAVDIADQQSTCSEDMASVISGAGPDGVQHCASDFSEQRNVCSDVEQDHEHPRIAIKEHTAALAESTELVRRADNSHMDTTFSVATRASYRRGCLERKASTGRPPSTLRAWVQTLVSRREFIGIMVFFIVCNSVIAGLEVEFTALVPQHEISPVWNILNIAFCWIFLTEIILKWIAVGFREFFCGIDLFWNILDVVIVFLSVLELIADFLILTLEKTYANMSYLGILRLLRLARILRGIRVMRILRWVSSLRTLVHSIVNTLRSLMWTLFLLFLLLYAFGITLTQLTTDHCRYSSVEDLGDDEAAPHCTTVELGEYWSSLPESMLTLFKSVTNGIAWQDALDPLQEVSLLAVFIFLTYLFITLFAVFNVVIGVFCHTAIESANSDKDMAVMIQLINQKKYVNTIRRIFKEIDEDASDQITIDEFQRGLQDEKLKAYFESIGIVTQDAWSLFKMIDVDRSGCIDLDEFVAGCLHLRGPAKAIQVAKMRFDNKKAWRAIKHLDETVEVMTSQLKGMQRAMLALDQSFDATVSENNSANIRA